MRPRTVLRFRVLLASLLAACDGSQTAPETARVASIQIAPNPVSLEVDTTLRLEATLRDHAGNELSGRRLFWASEDSGIASVSADGVVSSRSAGAVRVAASAEGVDALATVVVTERPVASVVVSPAGAAITVGEAVLLTAAARDAAGRTLGGRSVSWSSRDARIASVGPDGRVVGAAPGRTEITATVEGISAGVAIDVSPQPVASVEITPPAAALLVGGTLRFGATARAADGTALPGRSAAWSSSDPGVVSISPAGLATALSLGAATITATVEGRSASAGVGVGLQPVASVAVDPGSVALEVGAAAALSATTRAADGTALSGRVVVWSSTDPAIARVDASGRVTGIAPGAVQVRAATEGKSGSASVTVTNRAVAAVEVSPTSVRLEVGGTGTLQAVARGADGAVLSGRAVTWSSSAPGVATVDAGGRVTAVSAGEATVTAASEGKRGSASVRVIGRPAQLVIVGGNGQSGRNNQALAAPLVVRVLDAGGKPVAGVVVRWSTDNGSTSPAESRTDAQGTASTTWTLGGGGRVTRSATATVGSLRVEFTATRS